LLNGSAYSSTKSTTFTLSTAGAYVFRTTAHDPTNDSWAISTEYTVTAVSGGDPTVTLTSPAASNSYQLVGASISVAGTASDNGTMTQHWLEVKRPAGDWSWEGWLTSEPWGPTLYSSSYSSTKSTSFTLANAGEYVFRTTAYDPGISNWVISPHKTVQVKNAPVFTVSVSSAYLRVSTYTVTSLNNSLTSFSAYIEASGGWTYYPYTGTGTSSSRTISFTQDSIGFPPLPYTVVVTATDSFGTHTKRVLISSLSSDFNWQGFP